MMNTDTLFFFEGRPETLQLYLVMEEAVLSICPEAEIRVKKTQITFANRYGFAYASLPRKKINGSWDGALIVSFGLEHQVEQPRIFSCVEAYRNRWTHHVMVTAPEQFDDELRGWLSEAAAFALRKGRK